MGGSMSNPLLSVEQYGVKTSVKVVDERKYAEFATIRRAIGRANHHENG